jgi:hypothetical protein
VETADRSQVKEVSHDNKLAKLVRTDVNFVTEPRSDRIFRLLVLQDLRS